MDFGATIKQIRKNKGMTLKEVAAERMSTAQLSRFENGKSEILAKDFHELLHHLHTTYDEFLLYLEDEREKYQFRDLIKIAVYVTNKDMDKAKQVGEEIKKKSFGPYSWEQFTLYFLDNIISGIEEKPFQSDPVLHYSLGVDEWGEFELQLYCLFSFTFAQEKNYLMMKTALKKGEKFFSLRYGDVYLYTVLSNNFGYGGFGFSRRVLTIIL